MSKPTDVEPEPCDTCSTGIAWMLCFDGFRRCRTCVYQFAEDMGWLDENPERATTRQ